MAKHDIVRNYIGMTAQKKIEFIYKNYKDLDYLKESNRDFAVETIAFLKQQENSCDDDLGVRVQTSFNARSITERMAFIDAKLMDDYIQSFLMRINIAGSGERNNQKQQLTRSTKLQSSHFGRMQLHPAECRKADIIQWSF